ncbi:hypothetical protein L1887_16991 [Cichorium endivia]|nr:hypothetical protein L1887_16991 [Cichorium endivia]
MHVTTKMISSFYYKKLVKTSELLTRDDSYVPKSKSIFNGDAIRSGLQSSDVFRPQILDSTLKPATTSESGSDKEDKITELTSSPSGGGLPELPNKTLNRRIAIASVLGADGAMLDRRRDHRLHSLSHCWILKHDNLGAIL